MSILCSYIDREAAILIAWIGTGSGRVNDAFRDVIRHKLLPSAVHERGFIRVNVNKQECVFLQCFRVGFDMDVVNRAGQRLLGATGFCKISAVLACYAAAVFPLMWLQHSRPPVLSVLAAGVFHLAPPGWSSPDPPPSARPNGHQWHPFGVSAAASCVFYVSSFTGRNKR